MTSLERTASSTVPASPPRPDRNDAHYGVASHGDDVRKDFRRVGWTFSPTQSDAHLFADHIVFAHVQFSRIWSSGGVRTSRPSEGRALVVGSVEGTMTIETPLGSKVLKHDQLAVLDASLGITIAHRAHVAVYEISLPAREIAVLAERLHLGDIVVFERATPPALVSMLNAMFNERLDVTLPGNAYRRRAVVDLLAATMLDELGGDKGPKPRALDRLVRDARVVIDQHYSAPSFNAAVLAKMLYLSRSQLYRAFERHHSTPRTEILQRRLREVARQLGVDPHTLGEQSGRLLDAALESSGFSSRRSLARAIASLDPAQTETDARADPDVPDSEDQPDRDPH
jgi:AraC-like DNA-binding protein